jgi:hypothetical protein
MNIEAALSVGTVYQNIAFYTFLALLLGLCIEQLRHHAKSKRIRANVHHK